MQAGDRGCKEWTEMSIRALAEAELKEIDKALQHLMDVVKEHGFDVNSPDVRRLIERRNQLVRGLVRTFK